MSKEDKVVVYLGNRNYYKYMPVAVTSLLENTEVDKVFLLIEDNEFPFALPEGVETINISGQSFFPEDGPNFYSKWSYMTLMKMAIPLLFPEYDKVLVLDVDTIVDKDISGLWEIPLNGYCFAAVKERHKSTNTKNYYNAGVLLMNCKRLREGLCEKIIDDLNTNKYVFCEQDCINHTYNDEILEISSEYNVSLFNVVPDVRRIIHYAAFTNWTDKPHYEKYLRRYEKKIR